ncbi:MAG: glycoside hydrolase family 3 C-terminal domain-containing protein [Bacteroidota bacterium]
MKKELGLFRNVTYPDARYEGFASKANAEAAYQTACESITLLKNENRVLPVDLKKEKVLVCGPSANSLNLLNGGWTHTWQGTDARFNTKGKQTIREALIGKSQEGQVVFAEGSTTDSLTDIDRCLALAATVEKIIVCLGETPCTEIPGNIDDLSLPPAQQELVDRLYSTGKPILLVCCFNRPRVIHTLVKKASAILYAYLPGDEGGKAIADCITGEREPGGRLPFTYPAATNALIKYDHKHSEQLATDFSKNGYRPEFDFGSGFGYTSFEYKEAALSRDSFDDDSRMELRVRILNTGNRTGQEVVQVYYRDEIASITPSAKKLVAYRKVSLEPNEEKEVIFAFSKNDFSFVNKELQRVTEPGDFQLMVAGIKIPFHVR